ncbi:MAG TPA: aldo/keto reductase [Magnetospirillaceae bacterium]|jgi:aryl-alcohol dehydrogenase-like predicted oxidoreductase
MEIRNLGRSGLRVSLVGLGANNFGWRIDTEATRKVVHAALDRGITFIDTADMYGDGQSEEMLGKALGSHRKDVVLATKFAAAFGGVEGGPFGSRRYIMSAVEDSLKRLGTDWIDLYQYHWSDPRTPMEETLRALDDLTRQGKIRYIGLSNHAGWQVVDAHWIARHLGLNAPVSCQDEYSLLVRGVERELVPAIRSLGMGLLPYFPLASGLLSGKYKKGAALPTDARFASKSMGGLGNRYMTDRNWPIVTQLEKFCAERGHSMLELAFSWLASNPTVSSVIAGATKPEQIQQNVAAANWKLTGDEIAAIDSMTRVP